MSAVSSRLELQVAKALARKDFDVAACADALRNKLPGDISSSLEQRERRDFLVSSLQDSTAAKAAFERVLLGNELQPIAYLARGTIASRSIARIEIRSPSGALEGWGTGFLISPGVLITNNHVFPDAASAKGSMAQFMYETGVDDEQQAMVAFALDPGAFFHTSSDLDFSVVAVRPTAETGGASVTDFGCLPLLATTGKAFEGEWLTIVQHPSGERKQICVRENRLIKKADDVLWYSTDTLPGSSGSPVFNNDWYVVALHHSGIPEIKDGKWQTIDGRDFDSASMDEKQIKWVANEGIRSSRIVQALKAAYPSHPLLQPLYAATPASARITASNAKPIQESRVMSESRTLNVPLAISLLPGGEVNVRVGSSSESFGAAEKATGTKKEAKFESPFDSDYAKRAGFDPDFLGNGAKRVSLPKLSASLAAEAAPMITPIGANKHVLHYHNYSLVMHATRRFAIYSAANIRFDQRFDMNRPPDVWRRDPRILDKFQIQNFYYASNQFDRGHLTRREDLEFGKTAKIALTSAADTCHWTNCTPQHAKFNQNREIWQGIERHILEDTVLTGNLSAQVITGPVLDEGDPEYKDIQYPVQYWKVVAAIDDSGNLSATAYIASQEDVIRQFGIEAADVFGPFKTFQVKIEEIERLTDLTFHCGAGDNKLLRDFDPLASSSRGRRRGRRGVSPSEAAVALGGTGYYEIRELEDIVS
ncbi:MAG: DNA/RNA non-specific endonuclease [Pseudomonadota bacterium]